MSDWIDLTRRLDERLCIYREDGYADPPLVVERWSESAGRRHA